MQGGEFCLRIGVESEGIMKISGNPSYPLRSWAEKVYVSRSFIICPCSRQCFPQLWRVDKMSMDRAMTQTNKQKKTKHELRVMAVERQDVEKMSFILRVLHSS